MTDTHASRAVFGRHRQGKRAFENPILNAIAPGIIESPMATAEGGAFDKDTIKKIVPCQRAGTPEEVAALAGFLAGPEAGYITGQVISVNGDMV